MCKCMYGDWYWYLVGSCFWDCVNFHINLVIFFCFCHFFPADTSELDDRESVHSETSSKSKESAKHKVMKMKAPEIQIGKEYALWSLSVFMIFVWLSVNPPKETLLQTPPGKQWIYESFEFSLCTDLSEIKLSWMFCEMFCNIMLYNGIFVVLMA